jgi:hypothetical protein
MDQLGLKDSSRQVVAIYAISFFSLYLIFGSGTNQGLVHACVLASFRPLPPWSSFFSFLDLEIRTLCVSGQSNQPENNKLYYVPKIAIDGLLQQVTKNEQH